MEFIENKAVATGKIVFMWSEGIEPSGKSDVTGKPYWCACCGDSNVPHPHNFNRHIKLDDNPDSVFPGLKVANTYDFENEALTRLRHLSSIEGKNVRITIEILPDTSPVPNKKVKDE
jgi:hypothetical protein